MQLLIAPTRGAGLRHGAADVGAGLLLAFVSLNFTLTYGALIFSGPLATFVGTGLAVAVLSYAIITAVVAARSTIPFVIAGPDVNAVAMVSMLTAALAAELNAQLFPDPVVLATVLATLAATSLIVGALLYLLGRARRGRVVQFIPYPVMAGFLTGTGSMTIIGAFRLATHEAQPLAAVKALTQLPAAMILPAAATLLGMLLLGRCFGRKWAFPAAIALGFAAFYATLAATGVSPPAAREAGLLLAPARLDSIGWAGSDWAAVRWDYVLNHLPDIVAIAVVAALTILINSTGIGLATSTEVDFNAELKAAGLANLAAGALCGIPGYASVTRTLLNWSAGARGRLSAITAALVTLLAVLAVPDVMAYCPVPVLVGLLLFLGIMLIHEWAVRSVRRLPRFEYALLLAIAALVIAYGFVVAVVIGLIAACVLFVFNYGRITCIKAEFSGENRASKVERTIEDVEILRSRGSLTFGLTLQGFLFFGTANYVLNRVGERLLTPMRHLVLDLKLVQGMDASASLAFIKLAQMCAKAKASLALAGLSKEMQDLLVRSGALGAETRVFTDVDDALQWVEGEIVAGARAGSVAKPDLRTQLAQHFDARALDVLLAHMPAGQFPAGAHLFRKGETGDSLYFIESGQVKVSLSTPDGGQVRLRSFGPGTIVGEMSLYANLQRTADVVTEEPTTVRRLGYDEVRRLEAEDASVAIQFHHYVIRVLASRLAVANEDFRSML